MGSLKFLYGFVEVDDTVQKRENVCAEGGNILHRPVVSIKYGK